MYPRLSVAIGLMAALLGVCGPVFAQGIDELRERVDELEDLIDQIELNSSSESSSNLLNSFNPQITVFGNFVGRIDDKTVRNEDGETIDDRFNLREVEIDFRKLGYGVEVYLRVRLDKTQRGAFEEFIAAARDVPEIVVVQTLLGRVDVRMDVIARDLAHYQEILKDRIMDLPHIADVEALMLVSEIKNDPWIAI